MPNWEDFLTSFDEAQPDVVTPWGKAKKGEGDARAAKESWKKRQTANDNKFYGSQASTNKAQTNTSSPNIDEGTTAKIKLLEDQLNAPGRTDAEKESARRLIEKLKRKGATK